MQTYQPAKICHETIMQERGLSGVIRRLYNQRVVDLRAFLSNSWIVSHGDFHLINFLL